MSSEPMTVTITDSVGQQASYQQSITVSSDQAPDAAQVIMSVPEYGFFDSNIPVRIEGLSGVDDE